MLLTNERVRGIRLGSRDTAIDARALFDRRVQDHQYPRISYAWVGASRIRGGNCLTVAARGLLASFCLLLAHVRERLFSGTRVLWLLPVVHRRCGADSLGNLLKGKCDLFERQIAHGSGVTLCVGRDHGVHEGEGLQRVAAR